MTREERLRNKCQALFMLVQGIQGFYSDSQTDDEQKAFIETVIGAAIWYLPKMPSLWTNCVSLGVLNSFDPHSEIEKPKLSEDHMYPRKYSARKILQIKWSDLDSPVKVLMNLYLEELGKFNYVTPTENKKLMKFQRADVFENPAKSYKSARIELVRNVTVKQLRLIKRRDSSIIARLLKNI